MSDRHVIIVQLTGDEQDDLNNGYGVVKYKDGYEVRIVPGALDKLTRVRVPSTPMVRCLECKQSGTFTEMLGPWVEKGYEFKCCGTVSHLDARLGGARTWLRNDEQATPTRDFNPKDTHMYSPTKVKTSGSRLNATSTGLLVDADVRELRFPWNDERKVRSLSEHGPGRPEVMGDIIADVEYLRTELGEAHKRECDWVAGKVMAKNTSQYLSELEGERDRYRLALQAIANADHMTHAEAYAISSEALSQTVESTDG